MFGDEDAHIYPVDNDTGLEQQLVEVVDPQAIEYGRSRYAHPDGPLFWPRDGFPRRLFSPTADAQRPSLHVEQTASPWSPPTPASMACPSLSFRTDRSSLSGSLRVPLTPYATETGPGAHQAYVEHTFVFEPSTPVSPAGQNNLVRNASQESRQNRSTEGWNPKWEPRHLQLADSSRPLCNVYQFGLSNAGDITVFPTLSFTPQQDGNEALRPRLQDQSVAHVICVHQLSWGVAKALGLGCGILPTFFLPAFTQPPPLQVSNEGAISINLAFPKDTMSCWLLARMEPILNGSDADNFIIPKNHTGGKIELDTVRVHSTTVGETVYVVVLPPSLDLPSSLAMTCDNEYWRSRFQKTKDLRRMMLLPICWYAVRRWDEASEAVSRVVGLLEVQLNVNFAQRLHFIRAHLLHSEPPLDHLRILLEGLKKKCNDAAVLSELRLLLWEYRRLQDRRKLCVERVQNVISLLYSHASHRAAEAAVRDSADMKQLSYMTMVFLPASFMAGVFGINSSNIDPQKSLIIYLACSIPLTVITIWLFVAFQINHYFGDFRRQGFWWRVFWPLWLVMRRRPSRGSATDKARPQAVPEWPNC